MSADDKSPSSSSPKQPAATNDAATAEAKASASPPAADPSAPRPFVANVEADEAPTSTAEAGPAAGPKPVSSSTIVPADVKRAEAAAAMGIQLSDRALAAGGRRMKREISAFDQGTTALAEHEKIITDISRNEGKFLVVGDGVAAPFMALCLRAHGIDCDLAHHPSTNDADRGTIVLTPSVTQLLGDLLQVSVPSGSVIGRILVFDHVGNDLCDLDLNEFREKGESPTFFSCERPKIESALLSLCKMGTHSCNVMPKAVIEKGAVTALPKGVRVQFQSGTTAEYRGIITTARNQSLVPELIISNEELQRREENAQVYKKAVSESTRWLEVSVPPLPELGKFEKRFTPGSQEIVEILTPRGTKMSVRPTMLATKLFYNCSITISDQSPDPRLKSTGLKVFWDETIEHWTAGIPGYVPHTLFKPMFLHMQQHFNKSRAVCYRAAPYLLPHWTEGGGRIIKIGHAVHGSNYDAIDLSDAQSFTDCFGLARTLAEGGNVDAFLKERHLQTMQELDYHDMLCKYSLTERSQFQYMYSRFNMKILKRYIKAWRNILKHYITVMPKALPKP